MMSEVINIYFFVLDWGCSVASGGVVVLLSILVASGVMVPSSSFIDSVFSSRIPSTFRRLMEVTGFFVDTVSLTSNLSGATVVTIGVVVEEMVEVVVSIVDVVVGVVGVVVGLSELVFPGFCVVPGLSNEVRISPQDFPSIPGIA